MNLLKYFLFNFLLLFSIKGDPKKGPIKSQDYLAKTKLFYMIRYYDEGKVYNKTLVKTVTRKGYLVRTESEYAINNYYLQKGHIFRSADNKGKEDGAIYLSNDLSIGNSWQDTDGVKVTVLDNNASIKVDKNVFKNCLKLSVYFPKSRDNEAETLIEYLAPRVGLVLQLKGKEIQKDLVLLDKKIIKQLLKE